MTVLTTSPVALSCAEGRYDCGHLSRSSSRPVKRALFLHLAEVEGHGYLGTRTEPVEVLAALALLRQGAECQAILEAGGSGAAALAAEAAASPVCERPCTPQQIEVLRLVAEGFSYPEIAEATGRAVETVRSLVKAAMRNTLTHNAFDAAVVLVGYGEL